MLLTLVHLITGQPGKKIPAASPALGWIVIFLLALGFGLSKTDIYGDKWVYLEQFKTVSLDTLATAKDKGWAYYTYLIRQITSNSNFYFILTAAIYLLGYGIFARRFFFREFQWYFLIAAFLSFAFDAYAVNTIRGGVAMSLFLVGISYYKRRVYSLLFLILAILFHKSMLLPVGAFVLTKFYNKPRAFLYFWVGCLFLSFINIGFVSALLTNFLASENDSYLVYLEGGTTNTERYQSGFRVDFIIYSFVPIFIAGFYVFKLKMNNLFYNRILNTYLFANAIWLLIIRMAFTDRVAFLSWFLIPFLLLFPLLKYQLPIKQKKWVFYTLLGIFSFTSFMYFK